MEAEVNISTTAIEFPPSMFSDEISKKEKMRFAEELFRERGVIGKRGRREKPKFHHLEVIDLYTHFPSSERAELKRKVFKAHDLAPDTEGGTTTKFIRGYS